MQQPTPRPEPMYSGAMTDENIRSIFQGAGDFIARELMCSGLRLYAYMIDGLVSGSDASEYIVRPISEHLQGQTMEELYDLALGGQVYNSVADPCQDLDTVAKKLVNGFCVVLFPGVGAIAFEVKNRGEAGPVRTGGGEYRQGAEGRLHRDGADQHQPHPAAHAHAGAAAV